MESQDKLVVRYLSVLDRSNLTAMAASGNAHQSPTRQYEPGSKTAPASTSPLGSRVDASAIAASQDRPEDSTSPPPTAFVLGRCCRHPGPWHIMLWPSPPLSMHCCLSRCTVASLIALLPILPHQCLSHCTSLALANRIRSCQRCWITPQDGCLVGEKKDGKILSHLHNPSKPSLLPLDELWWEKSSGWYCQEWPW